MFSFLPFVASWTVVTASLIPKKEITRSLSDMRPISGLCHFRKLLGHIWRDALPPLQWMARHAGFARGRQWASPDYVGQVALRQAFDKLKHSAVLDALLAKQVPTQLIAVLVAWWSQSEVSVRLQNVSSHRQIRVQRSVPQGAPESSTDLCHDVRLRTG